MRPVDAASKGTGRQACVRFGLYLILLTVPFGVLGCRTVQVRSVADPKTDFASYRTFNFAEPSLSTNSLHLSEQNRKRFQSAVITEMEKRACRLAEQPDLSFTIDLATAVQTYDKSNPAVEGGSIGANLSKHYGLVYNQNLGSQSSVNYTQGTLSFRAFDTKQDRVVWEGLVTGVVYENRPEAQVEKRIREAVEAAFADFPVKRAKK